MRILDLFKYKATFNYIAFIVIINVLYADMPVVPLLNATFSPADALVGFIYIFRDFAQREIKHYVFVAMFAGAIISYLLSDPTIAIASVTAFIVGEMLDWTLFTFTKKPLSERLIWSASISSPIDSLIFLLIISRLNWLELSLMTLTKIAGVFLLWYSWKVKYKIGQGVLPSV